MVPLSPPPIKHLQNASPLLPEHLISKMAHLAVHQPNLSVRGTTLTHCYTADQREVHPFTAAIPDFSGCAFPAACRWSAFACRPFWRQ